MARAADGNGGGRSSPLLHSPSPHPKKRPFSLLLLLLLAFLLFTAVLFLPRRLGLAGRSGEASSASAIVAADDERCSAAGAAALRAGGHAADAAVATALCLGVVHPMSSGIGGGAFILVRDAATGEARAFDARETAAAAATKNMYRNAPSSQLKGALSMGVPGELAGLHAIWLKYGRLRWRDLCQPAIKLAREGFTVGPVLRHYMLAVEKDLLEDPGLRKVFAPRGKILGAEETCYNTALADTLEAIANEGPKIFYDGSIGVNFVEDVKKSGGIVTTDDLRNYKVEITEAVATNAFGYTILGMPPPSSGTIGMALVLNILDSYKSVEYLKGFLGIHRLIESLKHMFAIRMDIGDPDFVNATNYISDMLSPSFAEQLQKKIYDNTTFDPSYYLARWSQLRDHGTSHLCIVDAGRNALSMTSTVNMYFGARVLSQSTGITLNDEMGDFSDPFKLTPDHLPPAPANYIEPHKRPLSSMTPIIVLKDNQLAGVVGASGGTKIIAAVIQVFLNHFVIGMEPLAAVQHPRIYHTLIPNVVEYENATAIDGELIELQEAAREFLQQRGHQLRAASSGSVCELIVHDLKKPVIDLFGRRELHSAKGKSIFRGMLTAVSDPRKGGVPVGL